MWFYLMNWCVYLLCIHYKTITPCIYIYMLQNKQETMETSNNDALIEFPSDDSSFSVDCTASIDCILLDTSRLQTMDNCKDNFEKYY